MGICGDVFSCVLSMFSTYHQMKKIYKLEFIQVPNRAEKNSIISPSIKLSLSDNNGYPCSNKKIHLTVPQKQGNIELMAFTNKLGVAIFNKATINRTGNFHLVATYGKISIESKQIYVTAPGMNYKKYHLNDPDFETSILSTIIDKKSEDDVIKYNGREL